MMHQTDMLAFILDGHPPIITSHWLWVPVFVTALGCYLIVRNRRFVSYAVGIAGVPAVVVLIRLYWASMWGGYSNEELRITLCVAFGPLLPIALTYAVRSRKPIESADQEPIGHSRTMILKPNYLRAVGTTYLFVALFSGSVYGGARLQNLSVDIRPLIGIVFLGATLLTLGVCLMFVPREIGYNANGFSCRTFLHGNFTCGWEKLVAYGNGRGVFLLKFEGSQPIQISGFGFSRKEWVGFKAFLNASFPGKQCSLWVNLAPVMRK